MDPLTLGIGAVGLGLKLFGGFDAMNKSNEAYGVQQQITGQEQQIQNQRQKAMELTGRRQQLEIFRNMQRVRAAGTNAAVNQGATLGSGYAGGQAQITGQGMFNSLGVNQNLEIGRNIFGINQGISNNKMKLSGIQSQISTDQGISSFGGSLMSAAPTLSNIAQVPFGNNLGAGGNWSGGPAARNTGGLY